MKGVNMSKELRSVKCQYRAEKTEEKGMFAYGTPILYGVRTTLWDDKYERVDEIIEPGAAAESIKNDDIRSVWNHDPGIVLGRKSSGTMIIEDTKDGVQVEIMFPDSEEGRSKFETIRRGDVDQMSFAFDSLEREVTREEKDGEKSVILVTQKRIKVYEVSPVTFPAYEDTTINARAKEWIKSLPAAAGDGTAAAAVRSSELRAMEIQGLEVL